MCHWMYLTLILFIMNTSKNNSIIKQLQEIIINNPNTIKAYVAEEALSHHYKDVSNFFSDLLQHGCISGMISSLIYYIDTHNFYDTYYDEIEDLRMSYESSLGKPITIKGDLKNFMAWFAFEQTAYKMVYEFGFILRFRS